MTIVGEDVLIPGLWSTDEEDQIGVTLWTHCMHHFTRVLGQRAIGLGYDSCNAAVAIDPRPGEYDTTDRFSIIYGTSRLYRGLDPDWNRLNKITETDCNPFSSSLLRQHAEQTAILAAIASGARFWDHNGHYHVYVDFNPCENCEPWLQARPENWYVHYYTYMDMQERAYDFKREIRKDDFGRYQEPPLKKRRLK